MKNLKKLVIASFMLVIAFVAVVSSTYAWFTASSEAKVNDITIGVVDANASLLISQDGQNWGKELDIDYVGQFTPVTMITGSTATYKDTSAATAQLPVFRELKIDQNTNIYDDAAVLLDQDVQGADETKIGYAKFELYIQLASKDAAAFETAKIDIDLVDLHAWATQDENGYVTEGENASENQLALSSFRMYVVNNDVANKNTMIQGVGTSATGEYGTGTQFDVSKNAWMSIYGKAAHTKKVNNTVSQETYGPYVTAPESGNTYTLAYTDSAYANPVDYNSAVTTKAQNDTNHEIRIDNSYFAAANVVEGASGVLHLTVYVWMEGWDGDNINASSGCQYQFGLQLNVVNPTNN